MGERWKNIPGYEDFYRASTLGRIKSARWNVVMQPAFTKRTGYYHISLSVNGIVKTHLIHRLVCMTFHPNPENKPWVNHIDGNKLNNAANNVEWNFPKEDAKNRQDRGVVARGEKHGRAKVTKKQVTEIRKLKGKFSYRIIGEKFNISRYSVYLIFKNVNWKQTAH